MRIKAVVVVTCLVVGLAGASAQTVGGEAEKLPPRSDAGLRTNSFAIVIDAKGVVRSILDSGNKKEVLPKGRVCPLLSVTVEGKTIAPTGGAVVGQNPGTEL